MPFVFQRRQLFLVILVGRVRREQQKIIEFYDLKVLRLPWVEGTCINGGSD